MNIEIRPYKPLNRNVQLQIKEYIEYYNTKRIKVKLKGLTPIEYRNQALQAA
ncbi:IS3 family transposase [Photobacterium lucens]|uniref:IS3 family transposase n=1 Tax=Photobacterium lucens TaxID=2562949 RepID=UPI003B02AD9F